MELGNSPALIIVDMENGFFREDGSMKKVGLNPEMLRPVVEPVRRILIAAREADIPVFFTREVLSSDYSDGGLFIELFPAVKEVGGLARGTPDVEIIDEVKPLPTETIVEKTLYTAFPETELEAKLKAAGVDTAIICGVTTECCVESTVRDAFFRGFRVIVPSDAVAAFSRERHDATLNVINFCFGVTPTASEVEEALLARAPQPVA